MRPFLLVRYELGKYTCKMIRRIEVSFQCPKSMANLCIVCKKDVPAVLNKVLKLRRH